MIPMMQHELVQKEGWLSEGEFIDIMAVAQATPGVFAVNMAGYIGYKLGGLRVAVLAALGNILPSFLIILLLAGIFRQFKEYKLVEYAVRGIRPVVVALIAAPVFDGTHCGAHTLYALDPHRSCRAHLSARCLSYLRYTRSWPQWLAVWSHLS